MNKIKTIAKEVFSFILTSERINSQRCLCKDMDTTKTIIDNKNKNH